MVHSVSMTLDLTLPSEVELAYLRGPIRSHQWEALVRRRLPCDPSTIRYAVGFGCARSPDHALTFALIALERDPQTQSQTLIPTCAPPANLDILLSNLLTPTPITLSPPKFKLKL